jgi:hypothetical protein
MQTTRHLISLGLVSSMLVLLAGCSHLPLPCNQSEFSVAYDKDGHELKDAKTVTNRCLEWADKLISTCVRKGVQ